MRIASRVFFGLGLFGLLASLLFATTSRLRIDNLQGVVALSAFFLACAYLARMLGRQGALDLEGLTLPGAHDAHEDEEIHLPGPSWAPAAYGVAALLLVLGLVMDRRLLWVGIAGLVATSIWWGIESVRDYRREIAHHKPAPVVDPDAVALAQQVLAFTRAHGGADTVVQHVGRGAGEIVLVGADGAWGSLVARDVTRAREACALASAKLHEAWPSGLGARVRTGEEQWRAMGGESAFSSGGGHDAPRDGTTQVAAGVFFGLALFALLADVCYAVFSKFRFDNLQGMAILTALAVAFFYLHLGLKNAKARPEDAAYAGDDHVTIEPAEPEPPVDLETLHLPGPSWWPAFFSIAAGLIVFGLVFSKPVLLAGVAGLVLCCVGWGIESVHEYRQQIAGHHHGAQDALHPSPSPLSH